ncbi:HTTM domain-containing protein [Antarcticibacterium flavum]|uniref:HTTM domain-containing protein n=1 Tax=Antarcticibacterium flavum TaxID=2058175 RepID=A0A5B7X507_9FLAO|nr:MULTISPECIES: HTTM domain-containing protein [Antarcticibacterium]MCM4159968.1 HTTM domain-containing protein [Antarcticibacterium sp. W02-3]QCY70439.1 HTTM domain-containing protein [Antarcticibacterium flavum]
MQKLSAYLNKNTEAAPLAVFRIFFGVMMFISILRFAMLGWIEKLYIAPSFFFSYYGFEWVRPLGEWTYLIFIISGISALLVAVGYKYRLAVIVFFLSFTYIELMDKTTYLNHYYFISILSFLLIFLPANAYYSIDAWKKPSSAFQRIPAWCIDSIKLLIGIVYFYAGLAKINSDWLLKAMPLKIWLPSKYDLPLLGDLLQQEWTHYFFSWSGMLYDLAIPFLLLSRKTRWFGFILVVVFHLVTRILFPIGMFPYIMIVSALIFFDAGLHHKILKKISALCRISKSHFDNGLEKYFEPINRKLLLGVLSLFFLIQLLFPWRYLLYPGELFWTEEGFRFSWRVMLMEKSGYAQFKVLDGKTGSWFYVDNSDFLSPFQEKQMATQPDFMLEYAHFLARHFAKDGHENIEIYVENYVALNGRRSVPYIDPQINLLEHKDSFRPKTFILPFHDTIKGI